jgi:pilus assembly protein Flp/PilA
MKNMMMKLYVTMQNMIASEEGQDLVEYALVVALIAFGAIAGMSALSAELNTAFNTISSKVGSAL